jgi:glycosyltransferase involved in cell wall biosynthesis
MQQGAFLAARAGFRPLVSMSWGSDMLLGARRGLGRWVARWTLHRSTLFLCDCRAVARVAEELGMPSERIRIFPWGVDLEHFHPAGSSPLRARLGWEEAFVLLSTRNWEPIYGLGTLAEGFVRAARVEPSLRLLMLGGGSLEGQIKATLAQAGMLERVHFAGLVGFAELPAYYHTADLYISASHSDGTSISLLEAMACGLPALVTDIPGNREWVTPGRNGWLFPPGDARALAQAILRAKGEPRLLEAMGAAARVIAEGRADWRRNQEELLHAYKLAMVLEGGPADER